MCTCIHTRTETEFKPGPISAENALRLIGNYKAAEGWADNATRAVWFSISNLKEIFDMINNIPGGDGVRIYFGKYPDNDPSIPVEYQSRKTLVLIPTVADTEEGILFHKNVFDVESLVDELPVANMPGNAKAYNHGDLCPPYCL